MNATREERRRARVEDRRRARRRQRRERWRPTRPMALALAAVVLAGALAFGALRLVGDGGEAKVPAHAKATRDGSTVVRDAEPVAIVRTPATFRIVYRLEDFSGRTVASSTDIVSVRRPFESHLETRPGRPPGGGDVESFQAARFAKRVTKSGGSEPLVLQLGPAVAPSDVRLAPVLDDAQVGGRLVRREVREVLGRRCQVYRSGGYLSASVLTAPTAAEHADSCVDEAGLVLEEVLVSRGRPASRRVAVEVEEDVDLDDALFPDPPATLPPDRGGGLVKRLKAGSAPPGDFLVLDAPPEGFVHLGRYSVIPNQPENFSDDPAREGHRQAGVVDVWLRGVDVLLLDQGATLRGEAPFAIDAANPTMELGDLGRAEVRLSALTTDLRVLRSGGHYVRVAGTLPVDALAAVATALRTEPGGTLELEDGQLP